MQWNSNKNPTKKFWNSNKSEQNPKQFVPKNSPPVYVDLEPSYPPELEEVETEKFEYVITDEMLQKAFYTKPLHIRIDYLTNKTVSDLRQLHKKQGLKGGSKMPKHDLINDLIGRVLK